MRPNAKHVRNKEGRLYISVWFSDLLSLTGHDPYERKPSRTTGGVKKKKKARTPAAFADEPLKCG